MFFFLIIFRPTWYYYLEKLIFGVGNVLLQTPVLLYYYIICSGKRFRDRAADRPPHPCNDYIYLGIILYLYNMRYKTTRAALYLIIIIRRASRPIPEIKFSVSVWKKKTVHSHYHYLSFSAPTPWDGVQNDYVLEHTLYSSSYSIPVQHNLYIIYNNNNNMRVYSRGEKAGLCLLTRSIIYVLVRRAVIKHKRAAQRIIYNIKYTVLLYDDMRGIRYGNGWLYTEPAAVFRYIHI